VYHIPDNLSSADAAPLQCAGATVYNALIDTVKAGDRVGVLGIGGLGHLAIQFATKLGAEVVVFSTTAKKEAEARSFGAKEFYLLSEPDKIKEPISTLILTGSKAPDFSK
jgi:D-arabinose 1-dehydrogenase-like Zn-dependent alcohol dehydrogenase